MYKLLFSLQAKKELKRISLSHQKALFEALHDIQEDPLAGKPLTREMTGRFSYRIGPFRMIYTVNKKDRVIQVLTAGHRSVVYK